jgi:hypothetical protein|tara:strand:+ start:40 stop:411 length:372 start_codon:yes stop_codon:yes gene_type:complete
MASQLLNVGLSLKASNINGLLTLNKSIDASLTYNDQSVTTDTATIAHGSPTEIVAASASVPVYVYIKNTDTSNYVKLQTSAGTTYGSVSPKEFAFFAVKEGKGLKVQADTADCVIEYITFNKA